MNVEIRAIGYLANAGLETARVMPGQKQTYQLASFDLEY